MVCKRRKRIENPTVCIRPFPLLAVAYLRISEVNPEKPSESIGDLWNQIVLLQHEICEIDLQIERQKFLIESLEPNVQKEIITLQESKELRLVFESKQSELTKVRNQLLEKIQRVRDVATISNKY